MLSIKAVLKLAGAINKTIIPTGKNILIATVLKS
jgi:hypothetical protein